MKGYILYGSIYMKCPAVANPYTQKRFYISGFRGLEEREIGNDSLKWV